jgi:hypothetical protein
MFLGFATKSVALCWFLQSATLVLVAYTMGVLPAICSNIYPAGVRISGFNFAYNTGMMTFGGLVSASKIRQHSCWLLLSCCNSCHLWLP